MRCFWTYCLTGVHTGQSEAVHFWWCLSNSLLVRHLRKTPLIASWVVLHHTYPAQRQGFGVKQRQIYGSLW